MAFAERRQACDWMQAVFFYVSFEAILQRIIPANGVHPHARGIIGRIGSELGICHQPHLVEFLAVLRLFLPLTLDVFETSLNIEGDFYIGAQPRPIMEFAFHHDVPVAFGGDYIDLMFDAHAWHDLRNFDPEALRLHELADEMLKWPAGRPQLHERVLQAVASGNR